MFAEQNPFFPKVDSNKRLHQNLNMEKIIPVGTVWIENLALEELNMDTSGMVHIDDHLNPAHFLEEASIDLMNAIRDKIEILTIKFNEFRGEENNHSLIKLFKISNTVNDFMLFRNSLRLVFSRKANDLITVGFLSNGKNFYTPRLGASGPADGEVHEIRAHLGPFNNITWKFQGEDIDLEAMIRHYLSEFIRNSAR